MAIVRNILGVLPILPREYIALWCYQNYQGENERFYIYTKIAHVWTAGPGDTVAIMKGVIR